MKGWLYTRHADAGVNVYWPEAEIMAWMGVGGYWDDHPVDVRGFVDKQIEIQVSQMGIAVGHAARYARAVAFGGLSSYEAFEVLRDRDNARHGHSFDAIDHEDLPPRYFRNAWRRGHNGNITLDLAECRRYHAYVIEHCVKKENAERILSQRKKLIRPNWDDIERKMKRAVDAEDIAKVWPSDEIERPRNLIAFPGATGDARWLTTSH